MIPAEPLTPLHAAPRVDGAVVPHALEVGGGGGGGHPGGQASRPGLLVLGLEVGDDVREEEGGEGGRLGVERLGGGQQVGLLSLNITGKS